jgi:hypothetical protein
MPSFILTDLMRDLWVEDFSIGSAELGLGGSAGWSVSKRRLRGGRREGVDLIRVDNGALSFAVVPTRGMGLWRASFRGDRVGWASPIADGPVNPSYVNLLASGGLGWLTGFDELLARCGLENNGAPYVEGQTVHTLHGQIANLPAHFAAVHIADQAPHAVTVEGHVDECRLFGPQIRMASSITTVPGSNRLAVRDVFTNLRDTPGEMQLLYHWNFGPPYMEEGARLVVPIKTVCPRDARAAEGIDHFDVYGSPQPGSTEQVYFFELLAEPDGRTLALLRNRGGDKGVALRFSTKQLPAFTLWKNASGKSEGYVTGLEPGTNYPNPKPFEKQRGRVLTLKPGESYTAETMLDVLDSREAVAAVEAEVKALQQRATPSVHKRPVEPFADVSP